MLSPIDKLHRRGTPEAGGHETMAAGLAMER
jgi:hypothetical protein